MFKQLKVPIVEHLEVFLRNKKTAIAHMDPWGKETAKLAEKLILSGKMIRGSLILAAQEAYSGKFDAIGLEMAAAMEMVQSAILVHDDIMDSDELRRGSDALHSSLRKKAQAISIIDDPKTLGNSLGICAGNILFFWSYEAILKVAGINARTEKASQCWIKELTKLGIAQMNDMFYSHSDHEPLEEEILRLYEHKTARYTFSLPMEMGAILGGAPQKEIDVLKEIGISLGLSFQIKDDMLNLFSDPSKTGKPALSDIRENKKTLLRKLILSENEGLQRAFTNLQRSMTKENSEKFLNLIKTNNIEDKINDILDEYDGRARDAIDLLKAGAAIKNRLFQLIDFNRSRTK